MDHSEEDEEMLSSDSEDAADTDSDEDFTPDMKTSPKRKSKRVIKTQKSQNKKVRNYLVPEILLVKMAQYKAQRQLLS